jgi:hypothetical protein
MTRGGEIRSLALLLMVHTLAGVFAATAARGQETYLTSEVLLQRGLDELLKRTGANPRVSRIAIEPDRITLLTQGLQAAHHTDQWMLTRTSLLVLNIHSVSGPTPYRDQGIVAETENSFFAFDEVALDRLSEVVAAAMDRAGLEETPSVSAISIERQVSILPARAYGDVRWSIALVTPRESATVYADAGGRIFAADLSQTIRSQRLNLLEQDDWPMADAQLALASVLGDGPVAHELRVYDTYVYLEADSPADNQQARSYSWDYSGVKRGLVDTPSMLGYGVARYERFALSELDLAALPGIKAAALAAFDSPGASIKYMKAQRATDRPGDREVLWYIDLKQADGQEGDIVANVKGEILDVVLPESRRVAAGPWLAPATIVRTLARIGKEFGAGARFSEIFIDDEKATVQVEDPQEPGKMARFVVSPERTMRFGTLMPWENELDPAKAFTLADIAALSEERLAELAERTLAHMKLDGAEVYRYTISRTPFMAASDGSPVVEVRAGKDNGWVGGWVVYYLDGTEVDVMTP